MSPGIRLNRFDQIKNPGECMMQMNAGMDERINSMKD